MPRDGRSSSGGAMGSRAERAAWYRDYAEQLRTTADGARLGAPREWLLQLADQFEQLAASVETVRIA